MKLNVLVIAAHPDDAELNIGGTIASLVNQGQKVGILDLTRGEMGSRGTVKSRAAEAEQASKILGISYRKNLNLGDSYLLNSRENQLAIISVVRETQPDICLIGAPNDRHPDHGKATQLSIDSLFYSGLTKIETLDGEKMHQEPWRPAHSFHYMQDRPFEPDFVFDISNTWELKKKAVLAFNTQFNVTDTQNEPETYISNERYFKQIEARARFYGHLGGFEFGEPLKIIQKPLGIKSLELFN